MLWCVRDTYRQCLCAVRLYRWAGVAPYIKFQTTLTYKGDNSTGKYQSLKKFLGRKKYWKPSYTTLIYNATILKELYKNFSKKYFRPMEKIYHIYIKNRCLFHSIKEEEFHTTWKTLNNMVGIMKTDYVIEDLSYEELLTHKDVSLSSSHWQGIYKLLKLTLKSYLTYGKRIYC